LALPYIFIHAVSIIKKFSRDLFSSVKDGGIAFFLLMEGTQCGGSHYGGKPATSAGYPHGIKNSISDLDMEGFWHSDKSGRIAVINPSELRC
jgi:hypothetical protein